MHALHLPTFQRFRKPLGGVLRGHHLRSQSVVLEHLGGFLADRAQLGCMQRAGVSAGFDQHLEKDGDRVRRRKDDEGGTAEVGDRLAHALIGGHRADLDRRDLDHGGAQVGEQPAERSNLMARPRDQVAPFSRLLADLGASVVEIPTIEIRPMPTDERVRKAITNLGRTTLVIFASANAVAIFFKMLVETGADARALHASKLCAIGQETAEMLENHGLRPEVVTSEYTAEGLAKALEGWEMEGMHVLVPRAEVARDALPSLLANRGAKVEILPVYRAMCPAEAGDALLRLFNGEGVDVITFTSSSTVSNFVRAFPEDRLPAVLGDAEVACMGPVTADTARKLGLRVDIVAREYTTHGLVQAIVEAAARR